MDGLTEGRIVHYIPPNETDKQHRAAIVSRVWSKDSGVVNLHVFKGAGGFDLDRDSVYIATSVPYSENNMPGTWHWIEKA